MPSVGLLDSLSVTSLTSGAFLSAVSEAGQTYSVDMSITHLLSISHVYRLLDLLGAEIMFL